MQAVYWFRKSAMQEFADAQYYLGQCYKFGWGIEKDENTALYWYEKAINNKNALSETLKEDAEDTIKTLKSQGHSSSNANL